MTDLDITLSIMSLNVYGLPDKRFNYTLPIRTNIQYKVNLNKSTRIGNNILC